MEARLPPSVPDSKREQWWVARRVGVEIGQRSSARGKLVARGPLNLLDFPMAVSLWFVCGGRLGALVSGRIAATVQASPGWKAAPAPGGSRAGTVVCLVCAWQPSRTRVFVGQAGRRFQQSHMVDRKYCLGRAAPSSHGMGWLIVFGLDHASGLGDWDGGRGFSCTWCTFFSIGWCWHASESFRCRRSDQLPCVGPSKEIHGAPAFETAHVTYACP